MQMKIIQVIFDSIFFGSILCRPVSNGQKVLEAYCAEDLTKFLSGKEALKLKMMRKKINHKERFFPDTQV
jgi:hypothetical protein